jgi:hypothetical protein
MFLFLCFFVCSIYMVVVLFCYFHLLLHALVISPCWFALPIHLVVAFYYFPLLSHLFFLLYCCALLLSFTNSPYCYALLLRFEIPFWPLLLHLVCYYALLVIVCLNFVGLILLLPAFPPPPPQNFLCKSWSGELQVFLSKCYKVFTFIFLFF